uniref:Uncharacterized protein n=1 Tax=Parascaris univalens TaxID=6257 RepID=A0A915BRG9_PARUN
VDECKQQRDNIETLDVIMIEISPFAIAYSIFGAILFSVIALTQCCAKKSSNKAPPPPGVPQLPPLRPEDEQKTQTLDEAAAKPAEASKETAGKAGDSKEAAKEGGDKKEEDKKKEGEEKEEKKEGEGEKKDGEKKEEGKKKDDEKKEEEEDEKDKEKEVPLENIRSVSAENRSGRKQSQENCF